MSKPLSTLAHEGFVTDLNQRIDTLYASGLSVADAFFCQAAVELSALNIHQHHGGPFGAVIVTYEGGLDKQGKGIGKPRVIGVGANHVVPRSDPSAHAEMEAYRDAASRNGHSDLKGAVLFTSCECCPMCLSCANAAGIGRIVYVNTRDQAGNIGFSDKLQYDLFSHAPEKLMTDAAQLPEALRTHYRHALGNSGAVVLDDKGEVYARADSETLNDPTAIASLSAVRAACAKAGSFHLPEGFRLIARKRPHPAGLITADWARMLRKRCALGDDATNPAHDAVSVDASKIVHFEPDFEQIQVRDASGLAHIRQNAALTYEQASLPDQGRIIPTQRLADHRCRLAGAEVFKQWAIQTLSGAQTRY